MGQGRALFGPESVRPEADIGGEPPGEPRAPRGPPAPGPGPLDPALDEKAVPKARRLGAEPARMEPLRQRQLARAVRSEPGKFHEPGSAAASCEIFAALLLDVGGRPLGVLFEMAQAPGT